MTDAVGFDLSRQQRTGLQSGGAHASEPAVLTFVAHPLTGLSAETVAAALERVTGRHEILRSTLRRVPGLKLPLQFVHEQLPVGWIDAAPEACLDDVVQAQRAALDLDHGPVLAAALVGSGCGSESVLVLSAFATVADLPTLEMVAAEVEGDMPAELDPIQYAEYVAWQQERLADASAADADNAAAAWQRLIAEPLPTFLFDVALDVAPDIAPGLPSDALVVPVALPDGEKVDTARWLAAWVLTLARLTGNESVQLGVELDPRQDPELAGAAGPYAGIAPITFTVPVSGSFASFTEQVGRDRDLASTWLEWAPETPLPAVLFSTGALGARAPRGAFQLELRVEPDGSAAQLVVGPQGSGGLAQRVARALSVVLLSAGGAVADADVLDADGIAGLLGAAPIPVSVTPVITRLLAQARQHPDRIALTDGARRLSYAQLVERIDALASALLDAGAGPAAPVASYLDRGLDLIVAMLAAQRAGAGYLALDLHQPPNRSLYQLQVAGATLLVSDGAGLEGFNGRLIPFGSSGSGALSEASPEQLSYLIFTSGSTGAPKGVAVSEGALANYVEAILGLVEGVTGGSNQPLAWALMTSPTTDLGNTAIFPALASGGTLHVVPAETSQDPRAFASYVRDQQIDVLKITPSHLRALLADDQADVLPRKVLFSGGEVLSWDLVDLVTSRGSCQIVNHYGPTETTVGALANVIDPAARRDEVSVPIGRALGGNEALVLDVRGRLVPVGAVGELAIGGAGLARGYWADQARTAERFVAHPYRAGQRVYLTGDLARRGGDGRITFLGRRDGQVKIRGFRIERGEIESALMALPGVSRAAVVVRSDVGPDRQLVAYVVSLVNPRPTEEELRAQLSDQLPAHMIPSRIVALDTLPLRPNGKLDEGALPVPQAPLTGAHTAPDGPTEERVAAIFAAVLGVESVGATEDFFALGGHSLLATQIIVGIRSALDVQLPVYAVFEAPTVRGLAEMVDQAAEDVPDDELARMIAELADLSDEEAAALLATESDNGGTDVGVTEQR